MGAWPPSREKAVVTSLSAQPILSYQPGIRSLGTPTSNLGLWSRDRCGPGGRILSKPRLVSAIGGSSRNAGNRKGDGQNEIELHRDNVCGSQLFRLKRILLAEMRLETWKMKTRRTKENRQKNKGKKRETKGKKS